MDVSVLLNMTSDYYINFTNKTNNKEEPKILELCCNYVIQKPTKHVIREKINNTENALRLPDTNIQSIYRFLEHKNLLQMKYSNKTFYTQGNTKKINK
jgi:hypothetical protein